MKKNLNETKDLFVDTVLISDEVIVKKIKTLINNVKLTVILSSYRKASNLTNILELLTVQSYKNFEIVIIDDNSNNEIENVFEKYNNIENLNYIKKQLGSKAGAKNIGLANARGDYIIFIEEDIITITENYLENMFKEISSNNAEVVVSANDKNIDFLKDNFSTNYVTGADYLKKEFHSFKHNIDTSLASYIFRKSFLLDYRIHFNGELLAGENIYFKIRVFDKVKALQVSTIANYTKKYSRSSRSNKIIELTTAKRLLTTIHYVENYVKNKIYKLEALYFCGYSYLELLKNSNDKSFELELIAELKKKSDYFSFDNSFQKFLIKRAPKLYMKMYFSSSKEDN